MQVPTLCRIVLYRLSAEDAAAINKRRADLAEFFSPTTRKPGGPRGLLESGAWPGGAQAHVGTIVDEGQPFPMLIVAVKPPDPPPHNGGPYVSGQVFLDGNDVQWITNAVEGAVPGSWAWPPRG